MSKHHATSPDLRSPKKFLGIPYDFRKPSKDRIKRAYWNPNEPKWFTPKSFGIGWTFNMYHLKRYLLYTLGKKK